MNVGLFLFAIMDVWWLLTTEGDPVGEFSFLPGSSMLPESQYGIVNCYTKPQFSSEVSHSPYICCICYRQSMEQVLDYACEGRVLVAPALYRGWLLFHSEPSTEKKNAINPYGYPGDAAPEEPCPHNVIQFVAIRCRWQSSHNCRWLISLIFRILKDTS
jgi:hypothetical protein